MLMHSWPISAPDNWLKAMDAKPVSTADLVAAGIERHEARWLLEEYGATESPELLSALSRRLAGEPLQYILGHWPFRGLDLDVDARVLIPRPETEELVSIALSELTRLKISMPKILDLGCGSGAIGLSLFLELANAGISSTVVCVDESVEALEVAKKNAEKHQIPDVAFIHSSWFDAVDPLWAGSFDLIVANPPYVGDVEFSTLDPILLHEPKSAIVSPDIDFVPGFADLDVIIRSAPKWLAVHGTLICEHSDIQRDPAMNTARMSGFNEIDDLDDLAGKPRVLVARR